LILNLLFNFTRTPILPNKYMTYYLSIEYQ